MECTRRGCRNHAVADFYTAASNLRRALRPSSADLWGTEGGCCPSALALFHGAAILIGGEANSEIENAAAEGRHGDVRRTEERRSGGTASQADIM